MTRLWNGLALVAVASGYYSSWSYSSSGGSPQIRSSVNNCSGRCCSGWRQGNSGQCSIPASRSSSSFQMSSTKPRFQNSGTSRSYRSSFTSGNSPRIQVIQPKVVRSSAQQIGKAWGSDCVLCNQRQSVSQRSLQNRVKNVAQPERGCKSPMTRVGSSCRMLTGPSERRHVQTADCFRDSNGQLENIGGKWTKRMCCCSVGKAWGTEDVPCGDTSALCKEKGYYSYSYKYFTRNGETTSIRCTSENGCETQTSADESNGNGVENVPAVPPKRPVPPSRPVAPSKPLQPRPTAPQKPKEPRPPAGVRAHASFVISHSTNSQPMVLESKGDNHNIRIETTVHRSGCGRSGQKPCFVRKTCGGNNQRPCVVQVPAQQQTPCSRQAAERPEITDSQPPPCAAQSGVSLTISRCGGNTNKPCGSSKPATRPVQRKPIQVVRQRPQRPCAKQQNRCTSRCKNGCSAGQSPPKLSTCRSTSSCSKRRPTPRPETRAPATTRAPTTRRRAATTRSPINRGPRPTTPPKPSCRRSGSCNSRRPCSRTNNSCSRAPSKPSPCGKGRSCGNRQPEREETPPKVEEDCGQACKTSPEQEVVEHPEVQVTEQPDSGSQEEANEVLDNGEENPAAPETGCNGGPCSSPEESAGLDIEIMVPANNVPCRGDSGNCPDDSGSDSESEEIVVPTDDSIPSSDCGVTGCDIEYNAYGTELDSSESNECDDGSCGNVDESVDETLEPNPAAPEITCNGGICGSPEDAAGFEIENMVPIDVVPCRPGVDKECAAASDSGMTANRQPQPAVPAVDCFEAGCIAPEEVATMPPDEIEVIQDCIDCDDVGPTDEVPELSTEAPELTTEDLETLPELPPTMPPTTIVATSSSTTSTTTATTTATTTSTIIETTARATTTSTTTATTTSTTTTSGTTTEPQNEPPTDPHDSNYSDSNYSDSSSNSSISSGTYVDSSESRITANSSYDDGSYSDANSTDRLENNYAVAPTEEDCDFGYELDRNDCIDVNECKNSNPCGKGGNCHNIEGSYECYCHLGYDVAYYKMGPTCEDIDECAESEKRGINPCGEAKCINKEAHFECECENEAEFHHMGKCEVILNYDQYDSPFSEMGQCFMDTCGGSSLGQISYAKCCCEKGNRWEADSGEIACSHCPAAGSRDHEDLCGVFSAQTAESASQSSSYSSIESSNLGQCVTEKRSFDDVSFDECCCATSLMPIEWGPDRRPCVGLHNRSFYAQCPHGKGTINGRDIDECETFGAQNLCTGGACINQMGGFACTCEDEGYFWEEGQCVNFNECSLTSTYCVGGTCTDTDGSYHCECPPGQIEIDATCQPIPRRDVYGMMANVPNAQETDFDEPNTCYADVSCHSSYIAEQNISYADCCCGSGLSWGTKDQCFDCTGQKERLEQLCGNEKEPEETWEPVEDVDDAVYLIDDSESMESMTQNYGMTNYEDQMEYDDTDMNRPFSDQPRRRLPTGGRAAPISTRVDEKIISTNKAFSCGLRGGCGNGVCIQSSGGVSCKCQKGFRKNRQGKCNVPA